ncbi:MAG: sulfurtransferase TusA family protein [Campylobacteraceae bacterium]
MSEITLPNSVASDFEIFKKQYQDFKDGVLDALTFKTIRVPFGIYEQREANTYMVRVKLAGGFITPDQLLTLSNLAQNYADKHLHVTTRGGVQLHYAKLEDFLAIIEVLHKANLTGRGGGGNTVRNITADPYAGVAKDEVFDVTPHTIALTNKMLEQRDSYALPRKYKIAFSGSSADRGGATYIDVGFIAKIKDGQKGFRVFVAGGMGAKSRLGEHFIDFLPESDIFLVSQAIKEVFDGRGNRKNKHAARLRFLIDELGSDEFRKLVLEKIEKVKNENNWKLEFVTLPEVATLSQETKPTFTCKEEELWWNRFVTPQKQTGYFSAKVPLSLGDIDFTHARELANKLKEFSSSEQTLRFGSDQNIYIRNLKADEMLSLYPILKNISHLVDKPTIIGDTVACTGAATCQLGIAMPRGAALAIEKELAKRSIDLDKISGFKIHMSGCPNSCGKHGTGDLGVFGKVSREGGYSYPSYNILVGAKIGEDKTRFGKRVADISAFHLPKFTADLLELWIENKKNYEDFAEFIDKDGEEKVVELAKKYSKIPSFEEDKNPYFDFGAKELFSLKGRGTGECSAGMYDLIEADKKALQIALKEELSSENLKNIRLLACRMLLVAKGEDARDEAGVLKAFKKLFIDSGLIDAKFAPLLEGDASKDVVNLGNAIIDLYATMDNTLKFAKEKEPKKEEIVAKVEAKSGVDKFKDYKGVACPMNFVKTKMDLATMQSGQVLEIVLDDGAPIDNVPKSVQGEGHTILEQTKVGNVWHVKIKKK